MEVLAARWENNKDRGSEKGQQSSPGLELMSSTTLELSGKAAANQTLLLERCSGVSTELCE